MVKDVQVSYSMGTVLYWSVESVLVYKYVYRMKSRPDACGCIINTVIDKGSFMVGTHLCMYYTLP